MDKKLQKTLANWVTKIGADQAKTRLIVAGCSPRLAEQLVAGTYDHILRQGTVRAIERTISVVRRPKGRPEGHPADEAFGPEYVRGLNQDMGK